MTYADKLRLPEWQKKRLDVFERDGWECQLCMAKHKTLVVHHKDYEKGKEPWDYPMNWFVTLCQECHDKLKPNIIQNVKDILLFPVNKMDDCDGQPVILCPECGCGNIHMEKTNTIRHDGVIISIGALMSCENQHTFLFEMEYYKGATRFYYE